MIEMVQTSCPRPYSEWREDHGVVLWYLWPIVKTPWAGSPLDIGEMVKTTSTTHIGTEVFESTKFGRTGGWPWRDAPEDTLARLWWVPLPDSSELDKLIRDHIRGGPDPFNG